MAHSRKLILVTIAISAAIPVIAMSSERESEGERSAADLIESWFYEKTRGFPAGKIHAVGSGNVWTGEQEATEPFEKVWSFYSKQCGHDKPYNEKQLYRTSGEAKDGRYAVHDSKFPTDRTHTVFTYECHGHSISALVFRGEGEEKPTRIYLTLIIRKP